MSGITVFYRKVRPADVRTQKLNLVPGFRVSWHYSGKEVKPEAQFRNDHSTIAFVRNFSNNIHYKFKYILSFKHFVTWLPLVTFGLPLVAFSYHCEVHYFLKARNHAV